MPLDAFVGREAELTQLHTALTTAREGRPQLVLVAGEAGIGKTRLAQEFAAQAAEAGALVLAGRAHHTVGDPPYWLWNDALRPWIDAADAAQLQAALAVAGPEVAQLLPAVTPHLPDGGSATATGDADYREFRLFDGVVRFLDAVAVPRSLVLILDDVQWADAASLRLLRFWSEAARGPVLLVAVLRDAEAEERPEVVEALAAVARAPGYARVQLRGLDAVGVAALVAQRRGDGGATADVDELARRSGGNPLFLRELLHDGPAPAARVPQTLRLLVEARLRTLEPDQLDVLRDAAILGDRFDAADLAAMSGRARAAVTAILDAAAAQSVLDATARQFAHPLYREVLLDGVPAGERRERHRRAAQAIESARPTDVEALAFHYCQAGPEADVEQGVHYARAATRQAAAAYAWEAAVRYWRMGLDLLEEAGGPQREIAGQIMRASRLPTQAGASLTYTAWGKLAECALAIYEELGDRAGQVRAHLGLASVYANSRNAGQMDMPRAREHLARADKLLEGEAPRQDHAVVRFWDLNMRMHAGPMEAGLVAATRFRDTLDQIPTAIANEMYTNPPTYEAAFLSGLGRLRLADERNEEAWAIGRRGGVVPTITVGNAVLGAMHTRLDPRDAVRWIERERVLRQHGPVRRLQLDVWEAWADREMGDPSAGRDLPPLDELRTLLYAEAHIGLGVLSLRTGDWDRGAAVLEEVRDAVRRGGGTHKAGMLTHILALFPAARDDLGAARAQFETAIELADPAAAGNEFVNRSELAVICARQGDWDAAHENLQRCREILAAGEDWRGRLGRIHLAAALTALGRDQPGTADRYLADALAVFRRYAIPWHEAEAHHLWARAQLARSDAVKALHHLDAALSLYGRVGAGEPWTTPVERERQQAREAVQKRAGDEVPSAPLTLREIEVLHLLAQGRSNVEIAQELAIARPTASRHVSNLLRKLDCANRVEAAQYALRRGLVD